MINQREMALRVRDTAKVLFSRGPLWSLGDQIIVSGGNFLTMVIVARQVGLASFGVFTLYWTSALIVAAMHTSFLILPMVVLRAQNAQGQLARYDSIVAGLHLSFVGLTLAMWLPLSAAAIALGLIDGSVALSLGAYTAFALMHEYLRRFIFLEDRYLELTISDMVRYLLQLLTLHLLGGQLGHTIAAVFWILAGSALVGCLICLRHMPRPAVERDESMAVAMRHWSSSKWLLSSSLLSWLSTNSLMYLTGAYAGAAAVGGMRASQNLAGILGIPLQGLQNVVPTEAAKALAELQLKGLRSYLMKVGGGLLAVGLVVTAIIAGAPDQWLELVYGDEFTGYGLLLIGYALAFTASVLELPISAGLRAIERTRPVFVAYLLGAVFTLVGGAVLVPLYGVWGAMAVILAVWVIRILVVLRSLAIELDVRRPDSELAQ
ncbi:MATE family efflux transporter [Devosia sp.]|uniref:MATE family efflux transporter n=1 Tax=Devosia sp. TaxID=1871048 RepID=UPI001AC51C79|nr:MATE family efflux transporter [Devosia sp.]MBN9309598.1 hypothetical protein [Devosia sp.]